MKMACRRHEGMGLEDDWRLGPNSRNHVSTKEQMRQIPNSLDRCQNQQNQSINSSTVFRDDHGSILVKL